jgi:hypothetical protein
VELGSVTKTAPTNLDKPIDEEEVSKKKMFGPVKVGKKASATAGRRRRCIRSLLVLSDDLPLSFSLS